MQLQGFAKKTILARSLNAGDFGSFWNISCAARIKVIKFVFIVSWAQGTQRKLKQFKKIIFA